MSIGKKKWKFWGSYILQTLGTVAVTAVLLFILFASGSSKLGGANGWMDALHIVFPLYMMLGGSIIVAVVVMNYFQIYMPVFVSMGCTRREAICSILLVNLLTVLVLSGISGALIMTSQEISASEGGRLFLMCLGGLLAVTALCVILAVATKRWGKLGTLLVILFFMGVGGAVGAGVAMTANMIGFGLILIRNAADLLQYAPAVFAAGAGMYLLSCIFAGIFLRKQEVKL